MRWIASSQGAIALRAYNPSAKSIAVEITDNGAGIKPEFLNKTFDAFEQLQSCKEGLGLGLAIGKAIIEMHGGSISAAPAKVGARRLPSRCRSRNN